MEKEMMCVNCKKTVPLAELRANWDAKNWICKSCYEKQYYIKPIKQKDYRNLGLKGKNQETKLIKKQEYRCVICKFISKQITSNVPCPNCGRMETLARVPTVTEILEEVLVLP